MKARVPIELRDLVRAVEDRTSGSKPLERVAVAVTFGEALKDMGDELVGHFVEEARRSGCSWSQIGTYLGVSKQAAQQRHTAAVGRFFRTRRGGSRETPGSLQFFSEEGRRVITRAQEEARRLRHNYLGTEHLLLGLLRDRQSKAAGVLRDLGLSPQVARSRVKRIIGEGTEAVAGPMPFTPRAKKVLELSVRACRAWGDPAATPHHILLGLLDEGEGIAGQILADLGATRRAVEEGLGK